MRILCLDIGSKRVGIALSDPFGWTAQALEVLERRGDERDFEVILKLCLDNEVERVVVGIPYDSEGEEGKEAKRILNFCKRFEAYLYSEGYTLPVEGYDERYSTAEATERLLRVDMSRSKRKKIIDKMAAVVILENYLKEKGS